MGWKWLWERGADGQGEWPGVETAGHAGQAALESSEEDEEVAAVEQVLVAAEAGQDAVAPKTGGADTEEIQVEGHAGQPALESSQKAQ